MWNRAKAVCRPHVVGGAHIYLCSTNSFDLRGRTYPLISAFCLLILKNRYNPEKVSTSAYVSEEAVISMEFHSARNHSVLSVYNSSRLGTGAGAVQPVPSVFTAAALCSGSCACVQSRGPFRQRPCLGDWELLCRAMLGNPGLFSVKLLSPKLWVETAMRAAWLL